jgi:hypothetical protein
MHYLNTCYAPWVNTNPTNAIPTWKSNQSDVCYLLCTSTAHVSARGGGGMALIIAPSFQPADSDFWRDRDQVVDVDDFRRVLTVVQHTLTA